MKRFAVNVDDINEELFNEMLIVADVGNNHRATFESESPHEAAQIITARLREFFKKHFYEVDDNGYPVERQE